VKAEKEFVGAAALACDFDFTCESYHFSYSYQKRLATA
jgi:hypothetical protein